MKTYLKSLQILSIILIITSITIYTVFARNDSIILIVFFTGVIIFVSCLIFSYRQTEKDGHRRAARSRISITISVILFALILVLFQTISVRHNIKYDTTENKRFSLSPQTKKILDDLNEDIKITCFLKDTNEDKPAYEDLFKEYIYLNDKVEYEFVNPDRDPMAARRYNIDSFGVTIIESSKGRERINEISENILTNAIYRVTHIDRKNICFTQGHGEKSFADTKNDGISELAEKLKSENFIIKVLSLATEKSVPADCSVLVLAGPTKDILPSEKEIISSYLENGGKALFLIDPLVKVPRISGIAADYGIKIENTVIVDRLGVLTSGTYLTPVINRYSGHPITRGFKYFSFFPQARSISKYENADKQYNVTSIFYTNKKAYGETDIDMIIKGQTRFDEAVDKQGPISLAATSEYSRENESDQLIKSNNSPRLAVFGDSDFITNKILNLYGNMDLILNTVNWLAADENLISIRPKNNLIQPVLLTMVEGRVVFWLSTIVMPTVIAMIGALTLRRKKRKSEGF